MWYHLKLHSGEGTVSCSECGVHFAVPALLQRHMYTAHGKYTPSTPVHGSYTPMYSGYGTARSATPVYSSYVPVTGLDTETILESKSPEASKISVDSKPMIDFDTSVDSQKPLEPSTSLPASGASLTVPKTSVASKTLSSSETQIAPEKPLEAFNKTLEASDTHAIFKTPAAPVKSKGASKSSAVSETSVTPELFTECPLCEQTFQSSQELKVGTTAVTP